MNRTRSTLPRVALSGMLAALVVLGGCGGAPPDSAQGYVEGEFVYVAAPLSGALQRLRVQRGTQVRAGETLFELDATVETAALDEAQRRLAQARALLDDAKAGARPSELAALDAQLAQAHAAQELSAAELVRQEHLAGTPAAVAAQEVDRVRAARDQDRARVAQLEAESATARLGARADQIAAAEANVQALQAAVAKATWDAAQKRQTAPQAALVFDTLYREGEWIAAGRPAVALLPPAGIKVRAFVAEPRVASIHAGDAVRVAIDGLAAPLAGTVRFVSPQAEYTPPVIYSRESRTKLVFMVEIGFAPEAAASLHPGQPVDVRFGP